jgi:hypothetical protein
MRDETMNEEDDGESVLTARSRIKSDQTIDTCLKFYCADDKRRVASN